MSRVAFLGAGLIGRGFAQAEQRRGHEVIVWNRGAEKLAETTALGLRATDDLGAAVRGADRVHLALSADEAVDAVLDKLRALENVRVPVVDHSTTSPGGTRARAERMQSAGIRFFHAPVFMSPKACAEGTGCMVGAGPLSLASELAPVLAAMTGDYWYLGAEPDAAAVMKLFGNAILIGISGAMADAFSVAKAGGVAPEQAFELFSHFEFAPSMKARGGRMAAGDFATSFALAMARKDVGLMLDAAGSLPLAVLPGIAARMEALIGAGDGAKDLAVLAREPCAKG
jgi:3-hydroxyisobutyrate dehydrogenase-like beta-hydroxyacid dehydrogenase